MLRNLTIIALAIALATTVVAGVRRHVALPSFDVQYHSLIGKAGPFDCTVVASIVTANGTGNPDGFTFVPEAAVGGDRYVLSVATDAAVLRRRGSLVDTVRLRTVTSDGLSMLATGSATPNGLETLALNRTNGVALRTISLANGHIAHSLGSPPASEIIYLSCRPAA